MFGYLKACFGLRSGTSGYFCAFWGWLGDALNTPNWWGFVDAALALCALYTSIVCYRRGE